MPEITGVDVIRQKLIAANRKLNLANVAVEAGLPPHAISSFMENKTVPPAAALCALAKRFWPHAAYDPERNVLIAGAANTAYSVLPGPAAPFQADERCIDLKAAAREWRGPTPEVPLTPKPTGRPGWLNTLLGA
jgi:hypothetical protein